MSFQIYTHKQLMAASVSLDVIDSVQNTFKAIASRCDFTNRTYQSKVSYSRIAELTGLSERTVKYHVQVLVKSGAIHVTHTGFICKKTGQRRQSANVYTFCISAIKCMCENMHSDTKPETKKDEVVDVVSTYERLKLCVVFTDINEAWDKRGKRFVDNNTGGVFIHKSHASKPSMMIGYVNMSPAHEMVMVMLDECEKVINKPELYIA
jgi:DNA-binding Lrp family transcriptional regulator